MSVYKAAAEHPKIVSNALRWKQERDDLFIALKDLLRVISIDDLIPESLSYMKQAREAIAKVKL